VKHPEARLRKPIGHPVTSAEMALLIELQNQELRLLRTDNQDKR